MFPAIPHATKHMCLSSCHCARGHRRNPLSLTPRSIGLSRKRSLLVRADSATNERLSVDMKKFVQETQKNILELNKSRLRAIEEAGEERQKSQVKDAKIKDLMLKVAHLEAENSDLKDKLDSAPSEPVVANQNNNSNHVNEVEVRQPNGAVPQEAAAASGSPVEKEPPVVKSKAITVHYATGWKEVFFHFNADNKGWSKSPGKKMEPGSRGHFISVDASVVEFVLTNGHNEWDRPNPYSSKPTNYYLDTAGEYVLRSGRLHKV
ncbi:hypothetical protein BSKO_03700 [Bryopsis sp. KO-2023]|nr:hypothetical protein BSKO_03700 [Bryopsis sp. KO-2023]